jgi:hypothetical protein
MIANVRRRRMASVSSASAGVGGASLVSGNAQLC